MAQCELTHLERESIDVARLRVEHARYVEVLRDLGCVVEELPAEDELPDAVFVEDAAIVFDELAVLCRPGAESRRPEVESLARALQPWRTTTRIEEPGTLDGGDVLRLGKRVFVGLSSRSNAHGIEQLQAHLRDFGYEVRGVAVTGCLHLKSAACALDDETLLVQDAWVDRSEFGICEVIATDPGEAGAANVVSLGHDLVYPAAHPRTADLLERSGRRVHLVEYGELAKAEGGVTCCSLLFKTSSANLP